MLHRYIVRIALAFSSGCLLILLLANIRAMNTEALDTMNEDASSFIDENQNEIESTEIPAEESFGSTSEEFPLDESLSNENPSFSEELNTQTSTTLPSAPQAVQVPSTAEIQPSEKFGPLTANSVNLIPKNPTLENSMNRPSSLQESSSPMTTALQKLLADEFLLYTKTLNFHWNVVGVQFGPLHKLFNDQYVELANVIDVVAERIRALNSSTHATLSEFLSVTTLKEEPNTFPDAITMIRTLAADHELVIKTIRTGNDLAIKINDAGTNNFLSGLLEMHEKMVWMLRSHLQ